MVRKSLKKAIVFAVIALCLLPLGCGKGSDGSSTITTEPGGEVAPLSVAERVTVVDSKSSQATASVGPLSVDFASVRLVPSDIPPGTPYFTDEATTWIDERSLDTFNTVNSILCMINQIRYEEMMNRGNYLALVDESSCSSGRDSVAGAVESSENQSSSSSKPSYMLWTVNSYRKDVNSPHIIKTWVHDPAEKSEDTDALIHAKAVITEGKSEANPFGIFKIDFAGYPQFPDGTPNMHTRYFMGYLETVPGSTTGEVAVRFVEDNWENDLNYAYRKASFKRGTSGQSGLGAIDSSETWEGSTEDYRFNFAYDDGHFLRKDLVSGLEFCLDRDAPPDTTVWRYGLYRTDGARLTRSSGMPIRTSAGDQGWVGYWGMWFPDSVDVPSLDGQTVYKQTYSSTGTTEIPYTALVAQGRLVKRTKGGVLLRDIAKVPLEFDEYGQRYQAIWNGTTQAFQKTAILNSSINVWEDLRAYQNLSVDGYYSVDFWSNSLGGSLKVVVSNSLDGSTLYPTNLTNAVTYTENLVYPGQVPAGGMELLCFNECPDSTLLDQPSAYYPQSTDGTLEYQYMVTPAPGSVSAVSYTFDGTTMLLSDNLRASKDVVLTTPSQYNTWGIWTGPLIANTPANLSRLACDWETYSTCAWKAWEMDEYYTWETGPEKWNWFTGIKDSSGVFVQFEQPLQVQYVHSEAGHKYNGIRFLLEYNGFGDLQGIPGRCIDYDTGVEVSCDQNARWVPEFSIPDGAELTAAGAAYLSRAMEQEERMKVVDTSNCASLEPVADTASTLTLPDIREWLDPALGIEPTVTDSPAVIAGELQ